jgi:glycosyltransferase involved in cell wall biosynthesis
MAVKFLLANQSFGPYFLAIASRLAERGHEVITLSGEDCPVIGASVRHLRGPAYQRGSLRLRAQSWGRFLWFAARELPRWGKGATVLSTSNPPLLPHVCARALRGRARQVAWIFDLYPEALAGHPAVASLPLVAPLWRLGNRRVYVQCAAVATLGAEMAATLAQDTGVRHPLVRPLWHTLGDAKLPTRLHHPWRKELDIGGRLVVFYAGNLGVSHDLDIMVQAAVRLKDFDHVRFVVMGEGPKREQLGMQVRAAGVEKLFHFLPRQSSGLLPLALSLGDLAVVTVRPGLERAMMPSKTYNNLAAGSAILAVAREPSDLTNLVRQERCGVVVAPGDVNGFAAAIRQAAESPSELAAMRVRARQIAVEKFSPEIQCEEMIKLLESVAGLSS